MSTEITASTGEEVFRDGAYWLASNGKVYREEEHVATLNHETHEVRYEEGMVRYKNRVGRLLRSYYDSPQEKLEVPAIDSPEAFGRAFEVIKHKLEPEPEGPVATEPELTIAQIMGDYPDGAPATDWRGDLTPAFLAWYFEHYPERAKLRYEARGLLPVVHEALSKLSTH